MGGSGSGSGDGWWFLSGDDVFVKKQLYHHTGQVNGQLNKSSHKGKINKWLCTFHSSDQQIPAETIEKGSVSDHIIQNFAIL